MSQEWIGTGHIIWYYPPLVGFTIGAFVGLAIGAFVGLTDFVGLVIGAFEGLTDGIFAGIFVGLEDVRLTGAIVGLEIGNDDGIAEETTTYGSYESLVRRTGNDNQKDYGLGKWSY